MGYVIAFSLGILFTRLIDILDKSVERKILREREEFCERIIKENGCD